MSILGNPLVLCPALLAVTRLPEDVIAAVGETVEFRVRVSGPAAVGASYQWIYRTSPNDSWQNVTAASGATDTYSLNTRTRHNGYQYKCAIGCSNGLALETNVVTLTLTEA